MSDSPRVVPFDLHVADDHTLAALNEHQNRMQAERLPDDPPIPLEVRRNWWLNIDPAVDLRCWVAWDADERTIIANAWTEASRTEESHAVVNFNIMVLPEHRRQGLGRSLLAAIARYAEDEQRNVLITQTSSHLPAGALFMQQTGAEPSLGSYSTQLVLADLDTELLRTWIARAAERAPGFELGFWEGAYPECDLDAIAQLHAVMNTRPRRSSALEDEVYTRESLRANEQALEARGEVRWSAYAREQATNTLAGYTEVIWNPQRPELLEQGDTAVVPAYRNRGLGRWLKAAMLDKVLREQPSVRFVRTGNAATNAPMLKINAELGFKPFSVDTWWEMGLESVQAYLMGQ